jgi:plasmid stabilization system protein ParE
MAAVQPLTIRYLPPAERDIHAIADYLLERNPDAAARVRGAILRTLEVAAHFLSSAGGSKRGPSESLWCPVVVISSISLSMPPPAN